jgi:hypothetical protein
VYKPEPPAAPAPVARAQDATLTGLLEDLFNEAFALGRTEGKTVTAREAAVRTKPQRLHDEIQQHCQRREAAARGESAALRDAITSMTALEEDPEGCRATFSYPSDVREVDEVDFVGPTALNCCQQFVAWYAEAANRVALTRRAEP